MSTDVLRVVGITKAFGDGDDAVTVLAGVDFALAPGEKASLMGASGSGKSTLLSILAGLLRPDEGTVRVCGRDIGRMSESEQATTRADHIGIAMQSDNLVPFLTAQENVELALSFGTDPRRRRDIRVAALAALRVLGVAGRADHRPGQLSGGEAQRVALAVSMASSPDLLLADEVVGQLDGATAAHVVDAVLQAECAVLYVTHHQSLADAVQRRLVLDAGTVVSR